MFNGSFDLPAESLQSINSYLVLLTTFLHHLHLYSSLAEETLQTSIQTIYPEIESFYSQLYVYRILCENRKVTIQ